MRFPEYESFDGLGLANLVKTRLMSPEELLEVAIDRVEQKNPKLNAVITKMYDEAKSTIRQGLSNGLFGGVPFLMKDLLAMYAGVPTRCGSKITDGWVPTVDSEIVRRMKQAGLVIFGKTNTPELGLSPVTEPELFGPTHNPWDLKRNAGGSSGGSAAAVASRMVPMAHGGDGGGSIRIPASFCGVFGLKPTRGRTPVGPLVLEVWQGMVVEHVLTRSVRDSAAMLDILSGPELGSPISLPNPKQNFLASLSEPVRPLKIAVINTPFFTGKIHPSVQNATKKAASLCASLGHHVEEKELTLSDELALAYLVIVAAETAFSVDFILKQMKRKKSNAMLELATDVVYEIGNQFSAKEYAEAVFHCTMAGKEVETFLETYDVILTPTMPEPAPMIGALKFHPLEKNILEVVRRIPLGPVLRNVVNQSVEKTLGFTPFTPLFNITGNPAMSVPLCWDENNLPIGIQFAGRMQDELTLLQLAYQLEQAQPWGEKMP